MISEKESKLNVLSAMINEMSQFQLIFALTMIINGADLEYAIDQAYAMESRNHNKKQTA